MDGGGLLLVGLMWLVVNAIRKAGSSRPGGRPTPLPPPARGPAPTSGSADPTQREGLRLDELLRDLGRTRDRASGPAGRAPDRPLPPAEEVEELETLERAPEVHSLETLSPRPERAVVDLDDQAERAVARRAEAAEARLAPRTRAGHLAFDARIRQSPADATSTRGYTTRQLRDAVVWREILGPPVSLRETPDG